MILDLDQKYLLMMELMTREVKPTLRELAQATGISIGSVQTRLGYLTKAGMVAGQAGKSRSLVLTELGKMRFQRERAL